MHNRKKYFKSVSAILMSSMMIATSITVNPPIYAEDVNRVNLNIENIENGEEVEKQSILKEEYYIGNASDFEKKNAFAYDYEEVLKNNLKKDGIDKTKKIIVNYDGWQLMQLQIHIPKQDGLEILEIVPKIPSLYSDVTNTGVIEEEKDYWKYNYYFKNNGSYEFNVKYKLNGEEKTDTIEYNINQMIKVDDINMRKYLINKYVENNKFGLDGYYLSLDKMQDLEPYESGEGRFVTFGQGKDEERKVEGIKSLDSIQYAKAMKNLYIFNCPELKTIEPLAEGEYPIMQCFRMTEIDSNESKLKPEAYNSNMVNKILTKMPNLEEFSASGIALENIQGFYKGNGKISYLKCRNCGLNSLAGLENSKKLNLIFVESNNISSLEPLKNAENIRYMRLTKNQISDLSPLKNSLSNEALALQNFVATGQDVRLDDKHYAQKCELDAGGVKKKGYMVEVPLAKDINGDFVDVTTDVRKFYENGGSNPNLIETKNVIAETKGIPAIFPVQKIGNKNVILIAEDYFDFIKNNSEDTESEENDSEKDTNPFKDTQFEFSFNNKNGKDPRTRGAFNGKIYFKANINKFFNISYEFISSDADEKLPDKVMELLPEAKKQEIEENKTALPTDIETKEVKVDGGKWIFKGWDKDKVEKVKEDVKFTGKWEFISETKANPLNPKVPVENKDALTKEEKEAVEEGVKKANPGAKDIEVSENGSVRFKDAEGNPKKLAPADTIIQKDKTSGGSGTSGGGGISGGDSGSEGTDDRLSGKDRVDTSIEVSKKYFKDGAKTAILANGAKFSDVLASMPYSKVINAPILYTRADKTPEETLKELRRLGVENIILIGGVDTISENQMKELAKLYKVDRVNGTDRYHTAEFIADKIKAKTKSKDVIIASGETFPDALSVSPLALREDIPILLSQKDTLSKYTIKALNDHSKGKIYISGGVATITSSLENKLKEYTKQTITRFAGEDRYETSVKVAEYVRTDAKVGVFASGEVFADALLSGPVIDSNKAPVFLVKRDTIPKSVEEYLKNAKIVNNIIIGGRDTISDSLVKQLDKIEKH